MIKRSRKEAIKDLTPQQLEEYNRLALENQQLIRNINKRIKRLSLRGTSPAMVYLERENIPMVTRGLTLEELEYQNYALNHFNELKTSNVRGFDKYLKHFEFIGNGLKESQDSRDKFFKIYNKVVETNELASRYKYQIWEYIDEVMSGERTEEDLLKNIDKIVEDIEKETRRDKIEFNENSYSSNKLSI